MPSDARVLLGAGRRGTGQGLKIKGFMPAVSFQAVSKTFVTPKGPFQALNQVNLDIEEGEFFGLLGPNGAGKTTLISILAGLARATSGRVLVQGSDVQTHFAEARRKLGQQLDKRPLRLWPQRVRVVGQGAPLLPPKVGRGVHPTVTEAVLRGVSLSIRYRAYGDSAPRKHRVAPLGLVLAGSVGYVPVRFAGHDDVRTLALHRIESAELDDTPSGIESFDLDRWLAEGALGFGGNQRIRLCLRVWEGLGQLLTETPLADDQRVEDAADGSQQISATVLDTAQLRRWLLSLGARVEVLAPPALRAAMADELARSSRRYERAVPADQYA